MDTVPTPVEKRQSLIASLATKFAAVYFALWFLPLPNESLVDPLVQRFGRAFGAVTPVPNPETGSGDRLYDWLAVPAYLLIALLGAAIWAGLDRRRKNDRTNVEVLRVVLRYGLGLMIIGYGFAKTSQFPFPSSLELAKPLGQSTPMGLLWNFMGYSTPYSLFSGALEIAGGFLLLFRRTALLGATVFAAVMLNVFVLNLCYDVPVKLYSFHALLGSLVLIAPDLRRLLDVFVLNRPVAPRELGPPVRYQKLRWGVLVLKWAAVSWTIWGNLQNGLQGWNARSAPSGPLAGAWVPKAPGKSLVGVSFVQGPWGTMAVVRERGKDEYRATVEDDGRGTLTLKGKDGTTRKWGYGTQGRDALTIREGGASIELARDKTDYLLAKRRFHWVQERPRTP